MPFAGEAVVEVPSMRVERSRFGAPSVELAV